MYKHIKLNQNLIRSFIFSFIITPRRPEKLKLHRYNLLETSQMNDFRDNLYNTLEDRSHNFW